MIFLHDSLNSEKFKNDRKLLMLKKGVITPAQFINIIDKNDGYVMFGPAIIDREKISDFMIEWKTHVLNGNSIINKKINSISLDDIVNNFDEIIKIYPETKDEIFLYKSEIKNSICPKCTKSHHISEIINIIKNLRLNGDNRNTNETIELMIKKFSTNSIDENEDNRFDIEWLTPEKINGIGKDIIDNLSNCFECVIKHIGRAKILYEEFITGYPEHSEISFNEMTKGNKALDELYLKYMDSCAQMDMGSSELVGDIINLPHEYILDIIDLANEIRRQRILFQDDTKNVPDFDKLRLDVKKLELKIQTHKIE